MGILRKIASVSSLGAVDFKSDKERIATYSKQSRKELEKQTKLLQKAEANRRQRERTIEPPAQRQDSKTASNDTAAENEQSLKLQQLKALGELRDTGVLSPEEFEAEKAKILSK